MGYWGGVVGSKIEWKKYVWNNFFGDKEMEIMRRVKKWKYTYKNLLIIIIKELYNINNFDSKAKKS